MKLREIFRRNEKVVKDVTWEVTAKDAATAERERAEAEARYLITHPPGAPRISGCCDPADQA